MTAERTGRGRLPAGIVAGLTFAAGLVILLFLLQEGGGDALTGAASLDFNIEGFEEGIDQRLDPVALRPAGAVRVRVGQVVWRDAAGRPFLDVPSAVFVVDFSGGGGAALRVASGEISRPQIRLVRDGRGRWNYQPALAPLLNGNGGEGGRGGGGLSMTLANIVVREGEIIIELPDTRIAARSLEVRLASGRIGGTAPPTFHLASAEAALELPDTAGGTLTRAVALEDARLRLVDGGVAFEIESGAFGSSTFADASGIWNPELGGLGLDAELRAEGFRIADLPWLRAEVPADATGSFRLRIQPAGGGQTAVTLTSLAITAPGSSASGSLRAVFGAGGFTLESVDLRVDPLALSLVEAFTGPLPYTGSLRGTLRGSGGQIRFDLRATLATSVAAAPFETQLEGQVSFTPAGLALDRITTTLDRVPLTALDAIVPGLPFAGPVSGTVTLTGLPSEEPVRMDVRLEAGGGIVTVAGIVDLTGPVPAYDVSGTLVGVELRSIFEPAMPPAQMHATFDLEGRGTQLATADADVRLNGTFTGWRSEPGDTIALRANLSAGRLDVQAGHLELGPVALAAEGQWALVGGGGGAIRYALQVASLDPLAPYLPPDPQGRARFARGALEAEGQVSGTLDAPQLSGRVQARDFRFGEWAAERLEADYTSRFGEARFPAIEAEIAGRQIRTPSGDFATLELDVDFTGPTFEVALSAEQLGGGVLQLQASGLVEEAGGRAIELRVVEVDFEDQRWRLPSPARIAWTAGNAVRVEGLRMEQTGGEGHLGVAGTVAPLDQADFVVDVHRVPVAELSGLLGVDLGIEGELSLDGTVRGPSDAPDIDLNLTLMEGTVRDVAVRTARATVRYEGTELIVDGTAVLGDSARVELNGRIPARLALGLPPSLEMVDGREMDVRLVTDDFPLRTLDPGIRSVQDLEGLLRADVRIAGTFDQPRLTGDIQLADGAVTVPMLDKRYTDIAGLATFSGRELRVQRMVVHSGGTATLEGRMTFAELTNPVFDLTATLDGFQPQGVGSADDAAATGRLRLSGPLSRPVVSGRVVMDDGSVSLAPFTGGDRLGDRLVGVAETFAPIATWELDIPGSREPPVRVTNLQFVAGTDLWFVTDEARAQLRGTLDLETVGNDLTIQGTLMGEQGTFNLRVGPVTRRFNIVSANIRFFGSPDPNPGLDITASRSVATVAEGGVIDVRVRITGNLNNPHLSLGSAEGVAIAESELLSLILFGRQSYTAGDVPLGGQQGLYGRISDIGTLFGGYDLLSAELGEVDFLEGLDQFQLQQRGAGLFDFQNIWIIAGEQFSIGSEDVLVTLETPLQQGNELFVLAAEWRIDRQWTLELSWEPERYMGAIGAGRLPVPVNDIGVDRQVLLVIRRRWTY
ncbi:MAG TPA: translocation/assembly module TamB domain-containing protein [Longimicrobiales bacterium]|nr:translocation/assembly module TamB domain-containing protein [Longimicrobiales bacterium]